MIFRFNEWIKFNKKMDLSAGACLLTGKQPIDKTTEKAYKKPHAWKETILYPSPHI